MSGDTYYSEKVAKSPIASNDEFEADAANVPQVAFGFETGESRESGACEEAPHRKHPCKAWCTFFGGFCYMIFMGSIYCTGVFSTYIQSYYRIPPDKHYVQDLLPACLFFNMFFMPFGSMLVQRNVNPRILILIGSTVAITCFFLASIMETFTGFAIFYVFGFSFNHGAGYMVPVHHSWLWFPKNLGLVSGIILGGFGCAGLIFDNMFTHLINPLNKSE